jgi:preprotein translocase subunit SecG
LISLLLAAAAPAPVRNPVNTATAPPLQVPVGPATAPHVTWMQQHAGWLTHGLAGLFLLCALLLIVLLAVQTTKQEGLSGTIGGRVESAYGRPGGEEVLKRWTGIVAVGFVVIGTILSLTGI